MPLSDVDTTLPRPKRSWIMMSPATTDSGVDADLLPDTGLLPAKGLLPATGFRADNGRTLPPDGVGALRLGMVTGREVVSLDGDPKIPVSCKNLDGCICSTLP